MACFRHGQGSDFGDDPLVATESLLFPTEPFHVRRISKFTAPSRIHLQLCYPPRFRPAVAFPDAGRIRLREPMTGL
jgi:hypothetical protein